MSEVKVIKKPRPCESWEILLESVVRTGMLLGNPKVQRGQIVEFTSRLIDNSNAVSFAQTLGLNSTNLSELAADLRNMGAMLDLHRPGPGYWAIFSQSGFRPCN